MKKKRAQAVGHESTDKHSVKDGGRPKSCKTTVEPPFSDKRSRGMAWDLTNLAVESE